MTIWEYLENDCGIDFYWLLWKRLSIWKKSDCPALQKKHPISQRNIYIWKRTCSIPQEDIYLGSLWRWNWLPKTHNYVNRLNMPWFWGGKCLKWLGSFFRGGLPFSLHKTRKGIFLFHGTMTNGFCVANERQRQICEINFLLAEIYSNHISMYNKHWYHSFDKESNKWNSNSHIHLWAFVTCDKLFSLNFWTNHFNNLKLFNIIAFKIMFLSFTISYEQETVRS